MMTDSPTFPYIHDLRYTCDNTKPETCVVCGHHGRAYWLMRMHAEGHDEFFVCEICLSSGRLAEKDLFVNNADYANLSEQLKSVHPELTEEQHQSLVSERTSEVQQRTPRPSVLNMFAWPAHCGDYAVYYRQAYADDLNQIAPNGDGKAFFLAHLPSRYVQNHDETAVNQDWENHLDGFWRFYLWRCRVCQIYLLTYDCD
jgi:uncharacterized protein CbrC (UPF0167 family)